MVVSGDPRISMVEVVRDSGDGDAFILDTSVGMFGLFAVEVGSVELGTTVEHCGMFDLVVASTTDSTKTSDVEPEIMSDVGVPAVDLVHVSDTTPLAVSSEEVVSSVLVSDQLQLASSRL